MVTKIKVNKLNKSNKSNKINTEIVIARYNENLDWLDKIPKDIKITIYNKGINDINRPFIQLPNIGRESHTYLYHIINNYDNLAEQTIFCQGDSIFHSPGFIDLLFNKDKFQPVQPLSSYYWPDGVPPNYFYNPPLPILNETKNLWINNNPIHVEYLDNDFVTRYPYMYLQDHFIKLNNLFKKLYNVDNVLKFHLDRFRINNIDLNDLIPVCYAALFSVNKNVIKDHSVDFYNNIMSLLIYDMRYNERYLNKINGIKKSINNYTVGEAKKLRMIDLGLYLEKLWLVIFNYKKYNSNYLTLKISDFPIYNYKLSIKNNKNIIGSIIHFKLYIISCDIYIIMCHNDINIALNISKGYIVLKDNINKLSIKKNIIHNKKLQNIIKDCSTLDVLIKLNNNILTLNINNVNIETFKIPYNITKIDNAIITNLTNDNKFIDLIYQSNLNKNSNPNNINKRRILVKSI